MILLSPFLDLLPRFGLRAMHPSGRRKLIVDVSVIYQSDVHTGIQRVVRGVLNNIGSAVADDVDIVFTAASSRYSYREVPHNFLYRTERIRLRKLPKLAPPGEGDVFLALDLAAHVQPRHKRKLLEWQRRGCRISVVVYDLLPVYHTEWFSEDLVSNFGRWIRLHAQHADQILCISRWVASETARYIEENQVQREIAPEIAPFMLGADLASSVPTKGLTVRDQRVLDLAARTPTILCVGTIEPRKGHADVLEAFALQASFPDAWTLVIVGRPGWKTDELQQRMTELDALHDNFVWLHSATDEMLGKLYLSARGVIAASFDEGFGLPIIEALAKNVPVLARNTPVFQELSCPGVEYFETTAPSELAKTITRFVSNPPLVAAENLLRQATWSACASTIASYLRLCSPR